MMSDRPLIRGRVIFDVCPGPGWKVPLASRSVHGPLQLGNEPLAKKWWSTLVFGPAIIHGFAVTRFFEHRLPPLAFSARRESALINGRPVSRPLQSVIALSAEIVT